VWLLARGARLRDEQRTDEKRMPGEFDDTYRALRVRSDDAERPSAEQRDAVGIDAKLQ
jgi:hypothetical protein